jgi:hypothetical protein
MRIKRDNYVQHIIQHQLMLTITIVTTPVPSGLGPHFAFYWQSQKPNISHFDLPLILGLSNSAQT